ncbi:MAG: AAA family ATPase [Oscillospiraceae bacterium]|jgi:shikimate kinase|nr:AAA family ATPase [Oscillospiraceae bacterium]
MKNIILIGMPASGKSTVGLILAKLLGYDFIDTDIRLSVAQDRPLSQIIAEDGFDRFIALEGQTGEGLKCERTVVATGGSMIFSDRAMKALSENAVVVWLDAGPDELARRMAGTLISRGVATPVKMTVGEIYAARRPLYKKYANIRVCCAGSAEQAAIALRERLISERLI